MTTIVEGSQLNQYSVWLRTGWPGDRRSIPGRSKSFSCNLCVQAVSGAYAASCTMGTGGPFLGSKARPGLDADHSPPSSAEVVNEYELYILSPCASIDVLCDLFFTIVERSYSFGPLWKSWYSD
jgi:hypothetical protein